jgi:uncharacterized protein (DUF2235 family)
MTAQENRPASKGRNLVLCCDGTANEFARDRTNVVKLFYCLKQDPDLQIAYYHPGVGTMEPPGALSSWSKKVTRLAGLAFGYGLDRDIADAYTFLMNSYRPSDRVFLFGFSRGAYTARGVASLVSMYGLLPAGNAAFVPYAVRMLTGLNSSDKSTREQAFDLASQFRDTFDPTRRCSLHFVGVWDTVSSVGWVENPLHLPYTASNPDILHGRHAVAIDERRAFFRTNLWWPAASAEAAGPKDMKQVWFPGVHCDVGGGYPEAESGLSKIALQWMLKEAEALGLVCNSVRKETVLGERGAAYVKPDPNADPHESLKGWWLLAEAIWKKHYDRATGTTSRRMNLGRRRTWPPKPCIHRSAYDRGEEYAKRFPQDAIKTD